MQKSEIRELASEIIDEFIEKVMGAERQLKKRQLDDARESMGLVKSLYELMNEIDKKTESL